MTVSITNSINNTIGGSNPNTTNTFTVENLSNTTNAAANAIVLVGGPGAGNPSTTYTVAGVQSYSLGIDQADQRKFKISNTNALGTGALVSLASNGNFSILTGNAFILRTAIAGTVSLLIRNSDNTNAASNAVLELDTGGTSGGNAYILFSNQSTQAWAMGLDAADSAKFKISQAGALGSSDTFVITSAGDISIPLGNLLVSRADSGGTVTSTISNTSNTSASGASQQIIVAGTSGGNPSQTFTVTGASSPSWSIGADNAATQAFKLSRSTSIGTNDTIVATTAGNVTKPLTCAFLARLSSTQIAVTGDGTLYKVIYDAVDYDQNSNYNNSTGVFTAPVTGKYLFCWGLTLNNFTLNNTIASMAVYTSTTAFFNAGSNPFLSQRTDGYMGYTGSAIANMTAADTAIFQVSVSATDKSVNVYGSPSDFTFLSGCLIC